MALPAIEQTLNAVFEYSFHQPVSKWSTARVCANEVGWTFGETVRLGRRSPLTTFVHIDFARSGPQSNYITVSN